MAVIRDVNHKQPWVLPEHRALEAEEGEDEQARTAREEVNNRRAQERITFYFRVFTPRQDAQVANLMGADGSPVSGAYQLAHLKNGLAGADTPEHVADYEEENGVVTDKWLQQFFPRVRRAVAQAIDRFQEFGDPDHVKS